jgi:hypothetical protein
MAKAAKPPGPRLSGDATLRDTYHPRRSVERSAEEIQITFRWRGLHAAPSLIDLFADDDDV